MQHDALLLVLALLWSYSTVDAATTTATTAPQWINGFCQLKLCALNARLFQFAEKRLMRGKIGNDVQLPVHGGQFRTAPSTLLRCTWSCKTVAPNRFNKPQNKTQFDKLCVLRMSREKKRWRATHARWASAKAETQSVAATPPHC